MVCLPNMLEYPAAFLGILGAGLSVFPVSAESAPAELRALAAECRAAALVGTDRACAALHDAVRFTIGAADVPAARGGTESDADCGGDLLLCSSGTTGRPKIVVRSAASVDAVSANMVEGVGFGRDDRVLAIVPLCHSYGVEHGLLAPLWAGSTVHLCAGLDLGVVMPQLAGGGVTLFPGVPSAYDLIGQVAAPQPLPALRKAYAAGAPLPAAVYESFRRKFGVRNGQL
jgi:acyl-CoA synthetase (AMP-forming)/AMP-acid ligase II